MKTISPTVYLASLFLAFLFSCTDPVQLGQEIIEEDIIQVAVTDTFQVRTATVSTEPVRTYSSPDDDLILLSRAPLGQYQDPVFGLVNSNLVLQFRLPKDNFGFPAETFFRDTTVFDSIVLILPYTEGGEGYGKVEGEDMGLDVLQLGDRLDPNTDYFTDTQLPTLGVPLYSGQNRISLDSIQRINYRSGNPDTVSFPHLRIPLPEELGREFLQADSLTYTSDSLFQDFFQGIEIRPNQLSEGLLDIDLSTSSGGIFIYYRRDDTLQTAYQFTFASPAVRTARYEHNFSGSPVADFLNTSQDSLAFLQGMAGPMVEITFSQLNQLDNVIVNKAELVLSVAEWPGDSTELFPPPDQLLISQRGAEGKLLVIDDVRNLTFDPTFPEVWAFDQALFLDQALPANSFGGQIEAGENGGPDIYRINLTAHLQGFIEQGGTDKLFLSLHPKAQSPERVVFYGSGHSQYPPKLLLAITRLE